MSRPTTRPLVHLHCTPRSIAARRSFHAHGASLQVSRKPIFAAGEDEEQLMAATEMLTEASRGGAGSRWRLSDDDKGLERVFKFKTFGATWDFMTLVAAECKQQRHHPEWTNVFNKTHVRWTTHKPPGLSGKDVAMARFCDQAGARFGALDVGDDEVEAFVKGRVQRVEAFGGKS